MNYLILLPQGYVGKFVIPEGVGVIDEYACWYCSFLTEVVIPEGVLSIGEGAFEGCWELTTVYLPQSLMGINKNAFKDSDKITDVYYNGSITQWEKNVHKYYEGNFHLWNDGVIHYTCTHLNTQKTEDIKCLEPEKWTCSDCGEVYTVGNSLGHQSEFIPETSPTCTDPGTSGFGSRCSLCGFIIFEPQIIPALGHKGEWIITKEATKTEAGTKERTCTVCGEKEVVSYNLYKTGDVNGDEKINALDATQILRYANNKSSVLTSMDESEMYGRADVTGDGKINALDATQILRYANNKSSVLSK